jgi:hypothetical protein
MRHVVSSILAGLMLSSILSGALLAQQPEEGDKAPEINAKEWVNTIGQAPNLKSLRGQAVLIEFWATW